MPQRPVNDGAEQPALVGLNPVAEGKRISHLAYILLAFFVGFLGFHNFATGRVGRGLLQFCISITLLFGVFPWIGWGITIWVVLEIMLVRTDVNGWILHSPRRPIAIVAGIIKVAMLIHLSIIPDLKHMHRHKPTQHTQCVHQLKMLMLEMHFYTADHLDYFPAASDGDWQRLIRPPHSEHFHCPSGSDYLYLGDGIHLEQLPNPAQMPILMDRLNNHADQQVNIGFADGHVERVPALDNYRQTVQSLSETPLPEIILKNAEALDQAPLTQKESR